MRSLVLVCALAVALAGCGDDGTSAGNGGGNDQLQPGTSETTTSPPVTTVVSETTTSAAPPPTTAPPAAQSLAGFLETQPGVVAATGAVPDGDKTRAVFSRAVGDHRYATVAVHDGSEWAVEAEIVLPVPNYSLMDGAITYEDVTGDGHPDHLVPLDAASGPVAVLLSRQSGEWATVPVGSSDGEPYLGVNPRFVDGTLVTSGNDCDPTCAEGSLIENTWRFVDGQLVQSLGQGR